MSSNVFDPIYAAGQSLLRRPRHQGSVSFHAGARGFSLGGSVLLVGRRADSDFLGLGLTENPFYARLDARASLALGRSLEVFLAFENILDRKYMEALGYPALGRSVRVGLRYRGGASPREGS